VALTAYRRRRPEDQHMAFNLRIDIKLDVAKVILALVALMSCL
jgi:hypothetical protein